MACYSKLISFDNKGEWIVGNCYYNATLNKYNAFKDVKGLKVVYGSLGLNGHFEYGGKYHSVKDFYDNPFDSHAWLEDLEGNIYDYIFDEYGDFAIYWGKEKTFQTSWEILGISKEDLKADGIHYIPAPIKAQKDILVNVRAKYKQVFRAGLLSPVKFDNIKE